MSDANFERFDDLLDLSCPTDGIMFPYKGAYKSGRRVRQAAFFSGK